MLVRAGQHLYGNVEKEASRTGKRGFQTLGYTRALLAERDVSELESRLFYQASGGTQPQKQLFFRLTSDFRGDKFVISRVLPVSEEDRFGRTGLYLAHSLVVSAEEFSRLGNNPFTILEHHRENLISTVQHVLDAVKAGGDLPVLSFDIPESRVAALEAQLMEAARAWDPQELLKLAALAVKAPELGAERRSVAMVGSTEETLMALWAAFFTLPGPPRPHCSFDSHAYGSNPAAGYFWARCYPSVRDAPALALVVDAGERKVRTDAPRAPSPYEKWLAGCLSRGALEEVLQQGPTAWELQRLLEGRPKADPEKVAAASPQLLDCFLGDNEPCVRERLRSSLSALVGAELAARFLPAVLSRCRSQGGGALRDLLLRGLRIGDLEEELVQFLSHEPTPNQFAALWNAFSAEVNPPPGSSALLAFWKRDYGTLVEELDRVPEALYDRLVKCLVKELKVPPSCLVSAKRAPLLAAAFRAICWEDAQWGRDLADLATALLRIGQGNVLDELVMLLKRCPLEHVRALDKAVRRSRHALPARFRSELHSRLTGRTLEPMSKWTADLSQTVGQPEKPPAAGVGDGEPARLMRWLVPGAKGRRDTGGNKGGSTPLR